MIYKIMARTINEIQNEMINALQVKSGLTLSSSKVAEWRLWTYVVAAAIHTFEVALDIFKSETDLLTNKITPGTARWYAEMCYRYQEGHELLFDENTAMLYYEQNDPESQIIKAVAIRENDNKLTIKVATQNEDNKIIPLNQEELYNFTAYIDSIKFAGMGVNVVSTSEDSLRYNLDVYFEPSVPTTVIRSNITKALEQFKSSLGFDSMIYKQRFIDAVMSASGVVTCDLKALDRKGATDDRYIPVSIYSELEAGYFEYDKNSILTLKSVKELSA